MESEISERIERKEDEASSTSKIRDIIDEAIREQQECSNSRTCDSNVGTSSGAVEGDEERGRGDLGIDVDSDREGLREEIICRICHLSCSEPSLLAGGSELIQLGCHCRGELGMSHRYCAETWFNQRGNRACEICGAMVKNIRITKNPTRIWIVDFEETRPMEANLYASERGSTSRICRQSCCNLLLACIALGLIIPWLFRIKLF